MPFYAIGELILLALVYRKALDSARFARWMPWAVGAYAAYVLYDCLQDGNLLRYRPVQQVTQCLLVLVMVGLYFRKLLTELRVTQLRREPLVWVSAGLLFYCLGYIQIALFSDYMMRYSMPTVRAIWRVNALLFTAMYGCYCYALWLPQKK